MLNRFGFDLAVLIKSCFLQNNEQGFFVLRQPLHEGIEAFRVVLDLRR